MLPLMVSGIVVALMSKVMFDPFLGIINHLIGVFGLGPSAFYGAAGTAMPSIVAVDVWWQTAFVFIIMLAGLRGSAESIRSKPPGSKGQASSRSSGKSAFRCCARS